MSGNNYKLRLQILELEVRSFVEIRVLGVFLAVRLGTFLQITLVAYVKPGLGMHVGQTRLDHALTRHTLLPSVKALPTRKDIVRDIQKNADKQGMFHNQSLIPPTSISIDICEALILVWYKALPELYTCLKDLQTALRAFIAAAYSGELKEGVLQALDMYGTTQAAAYTARMITARGRPPAPSPGRLSDSGYQSETGYTSSQQPHRDSRSYRGEGTLLRLPPLSVT
ncbi:hypothetical protein SARC_00330 [Sphaeroforma arctica JP610]|uniref:Uncharacterized protein n=1 Tax=Sphaeroforma arctica JP610 TaxID=667725 RepID=A0A0L0GEX9_9EUKA|nr:hypothetical protein SARC_00330 [Sphaeroforma arctica JP610]KNC87565.1 hypothetical protein SARC_00330 [Sphaeroforma arctica JP610]|eukprot:XP_014161467.1 hypothetical protein SARC_00330 [Sphaeroforma arctica JP610]